MKSVTLKQVVYIINVIEPEKSYIKQFKHDRLDNCRQQAQEYLWSCPEGTKYQYVDTRIQNYRT